MTEEIAIVDRGRGLQLSTTRITVMDIIYYIHRGYDFDFIRRAMPTLTRPEFDVVATYVQETTTNSWKKIAKSTNTISAAKPN